MLSDKIVFECAVARATAEENLLKILIREQQKEAEVKNKNDGVVVNGVQYGILAIWSRREMIMRYIPIITGVSMYKKNDFSLFLSYSLGTEKMKIRMHFIIHIVKSK